ncbi:hypothetical protein CC1G_15223 [Coprinopsis cinerea okayama7|uniref:Uncharacterized protein n=1 Tax=Coprinopsis cinerea (strain Okayama-7 / 130 / ATCC MYA-4618 / FGSC 9003) TaxID=240176 RepID=D6RPU1_COPC7|nr:hypothetical protein CC1G_15223 [Coprinopsis cinerea okayama7\|eukprot:XP_002910588.1 hypothetical protein CC1G_15223 [Coprinopsis cinerea okayama7\
MPRGVNVHVGFIFRPYPSPARYLRPTLIPVRLTMKLWLLALAFGAVAPNARALIRFPCAQLVTERLDPLVTPGEVSPHLHQIVGGLQFVDGPVARPPERCNVHNMQVQGE